MVSFNGSTLNSSMQTYFFFGLYYGMLLSAHKFEGLSHYEEPQEYKWVKRISRLLLAVAVLVPFFLMFVLITEEHIPNVYALVVVKTLLPFFIMGFLFGSVCDFLSFKCRLFDSKEQESQSQSK